MDLLYGVVCLSLAALLFRITFLAVRSPKLRKWAGEQLVSLVYIPCVVGLIAVGVSMLVRFFFPIPAASGLTEVGVAIGAASVTVVVYRLLPKLIVPVDLESSIKE
jgi:hypothetical protein